MSAERPTIGTSMTGNGQSSATVTAVFDVGNVKRDWWIRAIAIVALVALGVRIPLRSGLTSGYLMAFALLPVWIGVLRLYWGARTFMSLGAVALGSGLLLLVVAMSDHEAPGSLIANDWVLLLGVLCSVGLVLWCREVLPPYQIGLWFGLGMLVAAMMDPGRLSSNPWKFAWAIPLAVVVLSLAMKFGRKPIELVLLLVLGITSAFLDSRSYFATFVLAALLLAWEMRPTNLSKRASRGWTGILLVSVSAAVYYLGTTLLVDGFLGQEAQVRSVAQIDAAGSLVLGGRPELGATLALIAHRPWGFGPGVIASSSDVSVAKQGMANLSYEADSGYVDNFMFGNQIELHSIFGDLWAKYGFAGIALTLAIGFLLARMIIISMADRSGTALAIFLSCWTLWNLVFSPFYGSEPTLILALGLGLMPVESGKHGGSRTRVVSSRDAPRHPFSRDHDVAGKVLGGGDKGRTAGHTRRPR